MRHVIKKQIFQLQLVQKQDAFLIQHLASRHYWNQVVPLVEKIFDEFSTAEEVVLIDKLEIDLGIISVKEMEQNEWSYELLSKIRSQLKEKLQTRAAKEPFIRQTKPLSACRQWLFYIQNGYLPWNIQEINDDWKNNVLEAMAVDLTVVAELRLIIQRNQTALKRVVMQHSPFFLAKLVEVMTAEKQINLPEALKEVYIFFQWLEQQEKKTGVFISNNTNFQLKLWEEILKTAVNANKGLTTAKLVFYTLQALYKPIVRVKINPDMVEGHRLKLIIDALQELEKENNEIKAKIDQPQDVREAGNAPFFEKTEDAALEKQRDKNGAGVNNGEKEEADSQVNTSTKIDEEGKFVNSTDALQELAKENKEIKAKIDQQEDVREFDHAPFLEKAEDESGAVVTNGQQEKAASPVNAIAKIDEEGIFVINAGLVLLHPFVSSFFKRLQMVNNASLIYDYEQKRALFLLHYLATGTTVAEEYELMIPKILCGWSIDKPVEKDIEFTELELNEADNLLQAAIEQWAVLKNTSIAGLREGFLQRKGKLFTKNDKLYLHVETNSIDVLLDQLPWILSLIKLPWMKELLRVEWR